MPEHGVVLTPCEKGASGSERFALITVLGGSKEIAAASDTANTFYVFAHLILINSG